MILQRGRERVSPISRVCSSREWFTRWSGSEARPPSAVGDGGFSVRHTDARKGKAGGGERAKGKRVALSRETREDSRGAGTRSRVRARGIGRAVGEISRWVGLINYYNEFHITIGVVKLRMVRVDPGSWVVHVQHGVRLASALRAVAQG